MNHRTGHTAQLVQTAETSEVLIYQIGSSGQQLLLDAGVMRRFRKYRQMRWYQKEAGGQLFATLESNRVIIVEATGPRKTDRRTRFGYLPDRAAERQEIVERHAKSLHYIGDWHTHPEQLPQPSHLDLESIAECFRKSKHHLNAFVLVVVGTKRLPDGLSVSIHDGNERLALHPDVRQHLDSDI